jgi:hypothetical protein
LTLSEGNSLARPGPTVESTAPFRRWDGRRIEKRKRGGPSKSADLSDMHLQRLGSGRVEIWGWTIAAWKKVPLRNKLFGSGFHAGERVVGKEPHTDTLLILMNFGLIGYAVVLLFIGAVTRELFPWRKLRSRPDLGVLLLGAVAMTLAAAALTGVLLFTPRAWYLASFLGFLSAALRLSDQNSPPR